MITERTLRKWRREALQARRLWEEEDNRGRINMNEATEILNRILRMSQELLDQHLLRKEVR